MQELSVFGVLLPIGVLLLIVGLIIKNKEKIILLAKNKFEEKFKGYKFTKQMKNGKQEYVIKGKGVKIVSIPSPTKDVIVPIISGLSGLCVVIMVGVVIMKEVQESISVQNNVTSPLSTNIATGVIPLVALMLILFAAGALIKIFGDIK